MRLDILPALTIARHARRLIRSWPWGQQTTISCSADPRPQQTATTITYKAPIIRIAIHPLIRRTVKFGIRTLALAANMSAAAAAAVAEAVEIKW